MLDKIQDLTQSMHFISKSVKEYVDNTHSPMSESQIADLKKLREVMVSRINELQNGLINLDYNKLKALHNSFQISTAIEEAINNQVVRIQNDESSSKNSRMYLSLLMEAKDIEESLRKLLKIIFDATDNLQQLPKLKINKESKENNKSDNTNPEQKEDNDSVPEA